MSNDTYVMQYGNRLTYGHWQGPPNRRVLPPGTYKPTVLMTENGSKIAFEPLVESNDKAVECNPAVTATLAEVAKFLGAGEKYRHFRLPHKRGYLFHGPPGCGKSTALRLLSEKFVAQTQGIVLRISDPERFPMWFENIRQQEPTRPVLAIAEDIDDDVEEFETGLLEFLDGAEALNDFVFVATTNNLDAIPDRIKNRPSRIDRVVEITPPTAKARAEYLRRFPLKETLIWDIAEATEGITMADLKEVVIATQILEETLASAVERVRKGADDPDYVRPEERGEAAARARYARESRPRSLHGEEAVNGS